MSDNNSQHSADSLTTIVSSSLAGGRITCDASDQHVSEEIQEGQVVIFSGVFDAEAVLRLRHEILDWSGNTPAYPHGISASKPGINFHRIDDDSAPTNIPHIFHQFGFHHFESLPVELATTLRTLANPLLDLQNRLASTSFSLTDPDFRIKVMHKPRGGGYLASHVHPLLPHRVALFLNLSQPGSDYHNGGMEFFTHGVCVDTREMLRLGDIVVMRADLTHGVSPIDPDHALNWNDEDGLWVMAVEFIGSHSNSRVA